MAHINQEKKKEIVANIKKEFPAKDGWKFSFGVENYSTLYCRLLSAPVDFSEYYNISEYEIDPLTKEKSINNPNSYEIERHFKGTEAHDKLVRIFEILNETNHNNSDAMTDYFDVGYYVNFTIGYRNWKTDKFTPFTFVGEV